MPRAGIKRELQARRGTVAAVVLLAGLAVGLAIYATAQPPPENPLGDQASQSKAYLREMETYGGKANVLASEIREWFAGLWHGRTLGVTVACLSALLALVVYLALIPLPPRSNGTGGGPDGDGDDASP